MQLCAGGRTGRPRDAEREAAILTATRDLVAESGYERLTIEAVAARAKASKATIYRRWSGKAGLVAEALRCRPLAMSVMPDSGDLRTDMVQGILAFVADLTENDAGLMVGLASAMRSDPELAAMVREQTVSCRREAAAAWLQRAVARGDIEPGVDTDVVVDLVPAVVFMRLLVTGEPVDEPFVSRLVDSVLLPLLTGSRAVAHV
ncbi:TetR/AcrR family transcriptional regulator [Jatrophihabitans sp. YIM 134969]